MPVPQCTMRHVAALYSTRVPHLILEIRRFLVSLLLTFDTFYVGNYGDKHVDWNAIVM